MLFGGFIGLGVEEIVFLGGILLPMVAIAVALYLSPRGDKDDCED
jgi:hypothetical protein